MKKSKDSSAKYYQNNKGRLQKKACEKYQGFSKEEKEKKQQCCCDDTKIHQKMKNKSLLSIEKMLSIEKKL